MKNSLADLNNVLFEQLERLNDEDIAGEKLQEEIKRANAIRTVSKGIIDNTRLSLDIKKHLDEYNPDNRTEVLGLGNK